MVIIFPPTSLSFMGPSVMVGWVWSYFTTHLKNVLIGWEPTVASGEEEEGAGSLKGIGVFHGG